VAFNYPTQFTTVNGLKTAYIEAGEGFPLILLHGLGASKYTWRYVFEELSNYFRVIAPDIKGFGESEHKLKDYSLESQGIFLEQFMQDMGIKKAHLVGTSMSGGPVLSEAYYHPENVEKIVVLCPAVYGMELPFWFRIFSIPVLRHIIPYFNHSLPVRKNLENCLYNKDLLTDRILKKYSEPYLSYWARYTFMRICSEYSEHPGLMEIFPFIHKPVLIVWGEKDEIIPMSYGEKLRSDLSDAKLEIIPKCGHLIQEEKPQKLLKVLLDYLYA
jgi:pimeloyl-ACP methyl ester carboxylesterase